jgi:hypothetical protein
MKRASIFCAMLAASCGFSMPAFAGAYCYAETINYLIVNGTQIFFTSNKSCPNWCEVGPGWTDAAKNRAYATMLASKHAGTTVTLYFNELTATCSGPVPVSSGALIVIAD